jgi:hypothetical protein
LDFVADLASSNDLEADKIADLASSNDLEASYLADLASSNDLEAGYLCGSVRDGVLDVVGTCYRSVTKKNALFKS